MHTGVCTNVALYSDSKVPMTPSHDSVHPFYCSGYMNIVGVYGPRVKGNYAALSTVSLRLSFVGYP